MSDTTMRKFAIDWDFHPALVKNAAGRIVDENARLRHIIATLHDLHCEFAKEIKKEIKYNHK